MFDAIKLKFVQLGGQEGRLEGKGRKSAGKLLAEVDHTFLTVFVFLFLFYCLILRTHQAAYLDKV